MFSVKTILHPTDLTETSDQAYAAACAIARKWNARLIALHIAPEGVVSYMGKLSELPLAESKEKLWGALRRPRADESGIEGGAGRDGFECKLSISMSL